MAAGQRSLLAFWMGGAAAAPVTTTVGVRSMLAPWIGGAASTPETGTQGSVRSLLAFWIGGAAAGIAPAPSPAPAPGPVFGGGGLFYPIQGERQYINDDDDLLVIMAHLTRILQ